MSSEARLFFLSPETKDGLRKFRLGTSRLNDMQAHIYLIDKSSLEIKRSIRKDALDESGNSKPYTSLRDLGDDLPDNSPRFVLLSYPITTASHPGHSYRRVLTAQDSGRQKVPYVMLSYLPETTNSELCMLYAGAKELMRNSAGVQAVLEIQSEDDLGELEAKLQTGE